MKNKKLLIGLIVLLLMALSIEIVVIVRNNKKKSNIEIEAPRIVLDKESYQLKVNEKIRLKANIIPTLDNKIEIIWESTNEKVAMVNQNGLVEAKSAGITNIVVKADGVESGVCEIIVSDEDVIEVKELKMNNSSLSLVVGQEEVLKVQIKPENAVNKILNWKSSNEEVVEVDPVGKVKAKKKGKTIIEVTSVNGKKATCEVEVKEREDKKDDKKENSTDKSKETKPEEKPVEKSEEKPSEKPIEKIEVSALKMYNDNITMLSTDADKMHLVITPENATEKSITWESSNPNVATVDQEGNIKAVSKGETTITATAPSGVKATGKVTVKHHILLMGNSKMYRPESTFVHHRIATQFLQMAYDGGYIDNLFRTSTALESKSFKYNFSDIGEKRVSYLKGVDATIVAINGSATIHKKGIADAWINKERYDIVVVEEGSANMNKYSINANNRQSVIDGMTWLKGTLKDFNGKLFFRDNWPNSDVSDYAEKSAIISSNGRDIANMYEISLIDDARVMLLTREAGIDPYYKDKIHANAYGSYAIALCMYAKVFNEDPRNVIWHEYIDDINIVNKLKDVAYNVCYN